MLFLLIVSHLPQDEMLTYNFPDGTVTPHVAIQSLARKFPHVLHVDQKPVIALFTSLTRLRRQSADKSRGK